MQNEYLQVELCSPMFYDDQSQNESDYTMTNIWHQVRKILYSLDAG